MYWQMCLTWAFQNTTSKITEQTGRRRFEDSRQPFNDLIEHYIALQTAHTYSRCVDLLS